MEPLLPHPSLLFTLAMFAVVIGVLVFIHEFGHYAVGRLFGVKAETFSIGFGREVFGWNDRRGTRWKISALPLGGYVKFAGDMNTASQPSPEAAAELANATPAEKAAMFQFKPLWQRALIIAAGPLTNFLFAVAVFALFFATYGYSFTPAVVDHVAAGSPAAAVGLRPGDRFIELDGQAVGRFEDVMRIVTTNTGTPIEALIERGGKRLGVHVVPKLIAETDRFGNHYTRGQLGVASGGRVLVPRSPLAATGEAIREVWLLTGTMVDGIEQVVTGRRPVSEMGGPISIAKFSGQQAALGWTNLVQFMALISINIGLVNLLPVPVLDGGHLFLYAVEAAARRPLAPKLQELAFASGFTALMSLMLFLTWNDLASLGVWKQLTGLFG